MDITGLLLLLLLLLSYYYIINYSAIFSDFTEEMEEHSRRSHIIYVYI